MKPINPIRLARLLRFASLAVFVVLALLLVQRYQSWSMSSYNDSMLPAFTPGTRLLVDYQPRPLIHGDVVIYELEGKGRTARVAAMGGDGLKVLQKMLYVNGSRTHHPACNKGLAFPKKIPPGYLFVLNDNPKSKYPDSFIHGPIPAGKIRGRVLMALDFLGF